MTRALILAAGRGTRMKSLTSDRPKCLLELNGQTLLAHQVRNLRLAGLSDITVVIGHGAKYFTPTDIKTHFHAGYADTNMVTSMFSVSDFFEQATEPVLVHYGDVIIEPRYLRLLVACKHDVACLMDDDWIPYFRSRGAHWRDDVEELLLGSGDRIRHFGGSTRDLTRAQARFVGALRFGSTAAPRVLAHYKALENFPESHGERTFEAHQLDSTRFLQSLINDGHVVHGVRIQRGWLELDCEADYRLACQWVESGELPFIDGVSALQLATP